MDDTHTIRLVSKGQQHIEPWWIRAGKPVPTPESRAEELRNQVSFANYDLREAGLPSLAATSVEDQFKIGPVPREKFSTFMSIVRYHGFELVL